METHISNNTAVGRAQPKPVTSSESQTITEFATKNALRIRARSKKLNITLITSHIAVVAAIVSILAIGYRAPVEATDGAQNHSILDQPAPSVDQIAAADVATSVAQSAAMPIETNVSSLSISLNAKTDLAQTDSAFLSKPQIVSQNNRKGVTQYVAKPGDTVQTVAANFGVSEDTVRWANKLTSDSLNPGTNVSVPGVTGVLYTIKDGDTPASLADKYHADKDRIVTFNDAELVGLKVGQQIIIPDGILPDNERPGFVAPRSLRSAVTSSTSSIDVSRVNSFGGNGYAYGYCTWYAYNRRAELGKPIGGNWGNAVTWSAYARAAGFLVDRNPDVGSVFQTGGGWSGYGHVGVVERVNADGSIYVSEMNYAGWGVKSYRTISAGEVATYNYIH